MISPFDGGTGYMHYGEVLPIVFLLSIVIGLILYNKTRGLKCHKNKKRK